MYQYLPFVSCFLLLFFPLKQDNLRIKKKTVQAHNASLSLHSVASFNLTPHLTSRLSPNFSLSPPPNPSVFLKPLFRNHLHRQIVRHMHKSTQTIVKVLMFLIICGAPPCQISVLLRVCKEQ